MDGQGNLEKNLESQEKVREFENTCKWLWQAVFRKFPCALGATLKGKNLLPWGANSFL